MAGWRARRLLMGTDWAEVKTIALIVVQVLKWPLMLHATRIVLLWIVNGNWLSWGEDHCSGIKMTSYATCNLNRFIMECSCCSLQIMSKIVMPKRRTNMVHIASKPRTQLTNFIPATYYFISSLGHLRKCKTQTKYIPSMTLIKCVVAWVWSTEVNDVLKDFPLTISWHFVFRLRIHVTYVFWT